MHDDDRPVGGLVLRDAIAKLSYPAARDVWRRAGEAIGWNTRHSYADREQHKLVGEFKAAGATLARDFWNRVSSGEIVAIGHPESPSERASNIPVDEWQWLSRKSNDGSTFEGGGKIWFRVMFYTRPAVDEWRRERETAKDMAAEHPGEADSVIGQEAESSGDGNWTEAFTTDEWWKGIALHSWVWECASEVSDAARGAIVELVAGVAKEYSTERDASADEAQIHKEVKRELDALLRDGLEAGLYVLGIPAPSPTKSAQAVLADALDDVIEGIDWWPGLPSSHYYGEPIVLRLYRPNRFADIRVKNVAAEGPGDSDSVIGQEAASIGELGAGAYNLQLSRGGRKPGRHGKLYNRVADEVAKLEDATAYFGRHGARIAFAREVHKLLTSQGLDWALSSIERELRHVLEGPDVSPGSSPKPDF